MLITEARWLRGQPGFDSLSAATRAEVGAAYAGAIRDLALEMGKTTTGLAGALDDWCREKDFFFDSAKLLDGRLRGTTFDLMPSRRIERSRHQVAFVRWLMSFVETKVDQWERSLREQSESLRTLIEEIAAQEAGSLWVPEVVHTELRETAIPTARQSGEVLQRSHNLRAQRGDLDETVNTLCAAADRALGHRGAIALINSPVVTRSQSHYGRQRDAADRRGEPRPSGHPGPVTNFGGGRTR